MNNSSYFFDFNNSIGNINSVTSSTDDSLTLSLQTGNNRSNITSNTYKELLDYCKSNNAIILEGFYIRVSFSFKIRDVYYCTNIYKEIDRNNLNDKIISIQNIESIKEI